MTDSQVQSVETLRKAVELAAEEVKEADNTLREAAAQKKKINQIPKRKAGGGKEAKKLANRKYQEARNDMKKKAEYLDKAQANLEYGEVVLEGISSQQPSLEPTTTDEDDSGLISQDVLKQPSNDEQSSSSHELTNNPGKARAKVPQDDVASELGDHQPSNRSEETHPDLAVPEEVSMVSAQLFNNLGEANPGTEKLEVQESNEHVIPGCQAVSKKRSSQDAEAMNGPEKKKRLNGTRGSRSTYVLKKRQEFDERDTEPKFVDELEKDVEWVTFLSDLPSDTDEEDRVEAVKLKNPKLNEDEKKTYRFMKPGDKTSYEKKARFAIEQYLECGKEIDSGIRRMVRIDPTFLPEAATTSRELALHFLTSKDGNIMCGYHAFKNKSSCVRDGWGKPGMKVRGVPGKRKIATSEQKREPPDPKGLGNCGCRIQDILLEFALSKLISISGVVDGNRETEMMSAQDYMEPRLRSFTIQAIRLMVPDLSLYDLYTHGDTMKHKVRIAKKRTDYWARALKEVCQATAAPEEEYNTLPPDDAPSST